MNFLFCINFKNIQKNFFIIHGSCLISIYNDYYFWKWKMNSIFLKMEDDLKSSSKQPRKLIFGKQPYYNLTRRNIEDNLNIFENGRRPQYFWKLKTTSIFLKMEDNLNIFENGTWPQYLKKWKTTSIFIKYKTTLIFSNR